MSFVKTFHDKLIVLKKYVEGTKMKKKNRFIIRRKVSGARSVVIDSTCSHRSFEFRGV